MEITSNSSVSNLTTLWEQNQRQAPLNQEEIITKEDSVQINNFPQSAKLLSEVEAEDVLQETIQSIQDDPYAAMYVHSGLDASRVAALIA